MELIGVPVNIFVLGDIVLDHFIPLTHKREPYQPAKGEQVFDGHPRRTVPGGAANSARVIAALGKGRVCLWGISGYSPWGSFVQILERSHLANSPDRAVVYHGSHNESHRMNTVTRLVRIDEAGTRHRLLRVDDVHKFHTTDGQRREAIAYLSAEAERGVHAIILNDLDMNSLSESLVLEIGEVASKRNIPLFVDPKRIWKKYQQIQVTCALPNLEEWCYIVEDPNGQEKWRQEIKDKRLVRLAIRSLRYMPNVDFHLIKCDKDGLVLIAPVGEGRRLVRHITAPEKERDQQIGAGDILVGVLALEYAGLKENVNPSERMLKALKSAMGVTACYLGMDWQEVPSLRDLEQFRFRASRTMSEASVPESVLLLPKDNVDLREFSVLESQLVSTYSPYKKKVEEIVRFLSEGWDASQPSSAILTGKGGIGKSDVADILKRVLKEFQVVVWDEFAASDTRNLVSALKEIKAIIAALSPETKGLLIVIDEAFSNAGHLLFYEKGKNLIQNTQKFKPKVRFLLIDADLEVHRKKLSDSQFLSRCRQFKLPPLSERFCDIPYIFAASCLRHIQSHSVKISEAVLLAIINWVLKNSDVQSARAIFKEAEEIVKMTRKDLRLSRGGLVEISKRHLRDDLMLGLEDQGIPRHFFEFSR